MGIPEVAETINKIQAHRQKLESEGVNFELPLPGELSDLDILAQIAALFEFSQEGRVKFGKSWTLYSGSAPLYSLADFMNLQNIRFAHSSGVGINRWFSYERTAAGWTEYLKFGGIGDDMEELEEDEEV